MPYKIGVTTGLYTIARAEEIATSTRKIGYALTRGTSVIEISGDVPHEITETDGKEIRYIAGKQGLELLFHGSLTIPMCIPERGDWRDAHDHMQKSIRSAVYSGCKYVNFHACLNIWLELMTYAGRKLTMAFCDHWGRFISSILKENKKLRRWFIKEKGDLYLHDILDRDERVELRSAVELEADYWRREQINKRLRALLEREIPSGEPRRAEVIERMINDALTRNLPPTTGVISIDRKINDLFNTVRHEAVTHNARIEEKHADRILEKKLSEGRRWYQEELRAIIGIIDGYHIMAHYLYYNKDPIWKEMAEMYKGTLSKYSTVTYKDETYSYPDGEFWLDGAWKKAEDTNDREFKNFFYGAVGAKFLEGHMNRILDWIDETLIKKELKDEKLKEIAKNLKIAIEIPDARDPAHAGLHLLWHPKQIYAAIKTIRKTLNTNRVWMLIDFEHEATQGLDPIKETEKIIKDYPDYGEICLAVHSNAPNPLHAHEPLELGDVRIYKLLWMLRKTGFGKKQKVYIIYERGGAKDPFQKSVAVLRLCVQSLVKDTHPDELPEEYFGMKGPVAGDYWRQRQIMQDHAWEPLKDMLEIPEEEWTMLSQAAIKKGKKAEVWKKGEFR